MSSSSNVVMKQKEVIDDAEVLSLAISCMENPKMFQYFVKQGCFGKDTAKAEEAFNAEYEVYKKNPKDAIVRYDIALEQAKKDNLCARCEQGGNLREVEDQQSECFIICRECWVEAEDNEEQLHNCCDDWTDDEKEQ